MKRIHSIVITSDARDLLLKDKADPSLSLRMTAVALGMTLVLGCSKDKAPPKQPAIPVSVAQVVRVSAPVEISANGVVEPLQSVEVQAQVTGTLLEVAFNEGDAVTKGQLLFRLDPRPFQVALKQAEAVLARDEAQSANAQRDAERYKVLVAKDYVTKAQADQAEAVAAALRGTLAADSAAVDNARLNLSYTSVTAPIAGRTGSLLVRRGNLVKASGTPLVVINQLQPILVRFPVPQADFAQLRRYASQGRLPVYAASGTSAPIADVGSLSFIDNAVDSLTGTVTAKAQFQNGGNALWPGEYVRLTVRLDVEPNVIAVPTPAVVAGQQGAFVFVVGANKTVAMRNVSIGRAVGELTIVDRGLAAGEQVVTDGQSRLTPGATIDIKTGVKVKTASSGDTGGITP